ncbi:MAG TPA: sugar ABC transporter substrate-binding protein [Ktedonobacteraceae bacterium]
MNATQRPLHDDVNRRTFLQMVGALGGGALFLTACGGSSSTPGKVKLEFWTPGGSAPFCGAFDDAGKAFTLAHPDITFAPVTCGTGKQDFNEALLARIAAGNPPDVVILWGSPVALGARHALQALDSYMPGSQHCQTSKWPSGALASCQFKGSTYGFPLLAGTYVMWYNQDWFDQKGISSKREDFPKTWDELRRLSKEFTHWNGDKLETAGFIPNLPDPAVGLAVWSALNGSQIYDAANQKYTIDSPENIALAQFFVDWLNEEYRGNINLVKNAGSWNSYPDDQNRPPAFQKGRLAMLFNGSWVMGDMYATSEPTFKRWNLAPLPVGPMGKGTVTGTWPNWVAIPAGSKNPADAFKYIDYLSVDGMVKVYNVAPDLLANKDAPSTLVPKIVIEKRGQEFAQEAASFFRQQQDLITPMWNSPIQDFSDDQLKSAWEKIMAKTATPTQALQSAQQTCQQQLETFLKQQS